MTAAPPSVRFFLGQLSRGNRKRRVRGAFVTDAGEIRGALALGSRFRDGTYRLVTSRGERLEIMVQQNSLFSGRLLPAERR